MTTPSTAFVNLNAITESSEVRSLVAEYAGSIDDQGLITRLGKFEREPLWTVYFWAWTLDGEGEGSYLPCEHMNDADYDGGCDCDAEIDYTEFMINADDVEAFPGLDPFHGQYYRVREDSQGYVVGWIVADREAV